MSNNPYLDQLCAQTGMTEWEASREVRRTAKPAAARVYPMTIGDRTYNSEAEYLDDLADFLNGM